MQMIKLDALLFMIVFIVFYSLSMPCACTIAVTMLDRFLCEPVLSPTTLLFVQLGASHL